MPLGAKITDTKNNISKLSKNAADKKRSVQDKINALKSQCGNFPTLPRFSNTPNQEDVINYLLELLKEQIGWHDLRDQLINFLLRYTVSLDVGIRKLLILLLKEKYLCKINPSIPDWMIETGGVGVNLEIQKIDFNCIFTVNPNTEGGKAIYSNIKTDLNHFLWDVIHNNLNPKAWYDPNTGKKIAIFQYFEESTNTIPCYTQYDGTGDGRQNINRSNNVINIKIPNEYKGKNLIEWVTDFFLSINLFATSDIVINTVDYMYGSLTQGMDRDLECVTRMEEFNRSLDKSINNGLLTDESVIDDTFFEFSNLDTVNIREKANARFNNSGQYSGCKERDVTIKGDTLYDVLRKLKGATPAGEKKIITKVFDDLSAQATNTSTNFNINDAKSSFFQDFIRALVKVLVNLVISPKTMVVFNTVNYLVFGKNLYNSALEFLKENWALVKEIIKGIVKKIVYDFLLPLLLNTLKEIIQCVIQKKLTEKIKIYQKTLKTLSPAPPPYTWKVLNILSKISSI